MSEGKPGSFNIFYENTGYLGFLFDAVLKFDKRINYVVRGSFFLLRTVAKLENINGIRLRKKLLA